MMKADLEELGIKIKAKHYNKEEIEEHLASRQQKMENTAAK